MDVTQETVAEAINITQTTYARYESGKRAPRPAILTKLAEYFKVSTDYLLGATENPLPPNAYPVENLVAIPVMGSVRCGPGGLAYEEYEGFELADVKNPSEYFHLRVTGDSMEPDIKAGMLALVHKQEDVESGELAVVVIDGDEGTLKKVIKREGTIILQAFNPKVEPRIFTGEELSEVHIVGKVVETKRKW
jgi:repressor LexA